MALESHPRALFFFQIGAPCRPKSISAACGPRKRAGRSAVSQRFGGGRPTEKGCRPPCSSQPRAHLLRKPLAEAVVTLSIALAARHAGRLREEFVSQGSFARRLQQLTEAYPGGLSQEGGSNYYCLLDLLSKVE